MDIRHLTIAAKIISRADHEHPADAVLRTELKNSPGITRREGALISRAVFAYYRWLGWLDKKYALTGQVQEAVAREETFRNDPNSISEADIAQAVPSWIKAEMTITGEWLRSLQHEPKMWLRTRSGTGKAVAERLGQCWVGEGSLADAVRYDGAEDLFRTAEFHAGDFELQDIGSQLVGLLCQPQPGEAWWDACAGEGGKTLHLSDLMRGKGMLWASDRAEWRLQKLKRRAGRAQVFNYRSALWDGSARLPTKTKFDGILMDAPCSGVGTWQRNPHARWTTNAQDVQELSEIQKELITNAIVALKPGGRLIYSVCTLTNAETSEVADAITQKFPVLEPLSFLNPVASQEPAVQRLTLWPQAIEGNGMFICGWRKKSV